MGLDNGIDIKVRDDSVKNRFIRFRDDYYQEDYYEACYMRKWWGVRNNIVNYLNLKYNTNELNDGYWKLDVEDLKTLIDIYQKWNNKETWEEEEGSSIWSWEDDIEENINGKIDDLKYLISLKESIPDAFDLFFYDSY